MELHHLRSFVAVAEELSFIGAAKQLHLTQPALTRRIKVLEDELNVRLFERSSRRVPLTEAGRKCLDGTQQALALITQNVDIVQRWGRSEEDHLSIGYIASLHHHLVRPTLIKFRRYCPNVVVDLHDLNPADQLHALASKMIDLAYLGLWEPLKSREVTVRPVAENQILLALPNRPLSAPG